MEKCASRDFVRKYLSGKGLEIGALYKPLEIGDKTLMHYQDRIAIGDFKIDYQENDDIDFDKIITPDFISDAEVVPVEDNYFDFVCNAHLFEHLKNPIKCLKEWLRVTKVGGYIYLIVPDMRYIFDAERILTTEEHLILDYENDVKEVEEMHYIDYGVIAKKYKSYEDSIQAYKEQRNIHVHTFTDVSLGEFLKSTQLLLGLTEGIHFTVELFWKADIIDICVLIKKE